MYPRTTSTDRGRFFISRKVKAIERLLRGEELEVLGREYGVKAETMATERDQFLAGGQAALRRRSS